MQSTVRNSTLDAWRQIPPNISVKGKVQSEAPMSKFPMDNGQPVWQLPISDRDGTVHITAKCHCFISGRSLCGRYQQDTDYYETDVSEDEVSARPSVACKRCYAVWKKKYGSSK